MQVSKRFSVFTVLKIDVLDNFAEDFVKFQKEICSELYSALIDILKATIFREVISDIDLTSLNVSYFLAIKLLFDLLLEYLQNLLVLLSSEVHYSVQ